MNFTYLFMSLTLPMRYKIGISTAPNKRKKQLDRIGVFKILALPCADARQVEKICHKLLSPLNTKVKGNGGTEWFWICNLLTASILVFLKKDFDIIILAVMFFPLPLDGLLVLVISWAVQLSFIVALVIAVIYLSAMM